jgi:hypothetical protein
MVERLSTNSFRVGWEAHKDSWYLDTRRGILVHLFSGVYEIVYVACV